MSSTLRAVAVASCTALLVSGVAASASASNGAQRPNVILQQTTVGTANASTNVLTFTQPLVISAAEVTTGGTNVVGQSAVLLHRGAGSKTWVQAKGTSVKKTNSAGRVHWTIQPAANGAFSVHFRQTRAFASATSATLPIKVRPLVHFATLHTVPELSDSTIAGTVRPHAGGLVYLQQFTKGAWHRSAKQELTSDGHFAFTIAPASFAGLRYRVVRHSDGVHAITVSHVLKLNVVRRTLELGDSGHDVAVLQKRLRKLHYDVGPASDEYGDDMLHAVTVFQKVQGFHPDGEAGNKVWKRLDHPKVPKLRYPYPQDKYSVEVNISKQVLLIAKYGQVWRILDTSTAGGYLYTNSEGGTSRAITPTGHFSFLYKITGWHKSKLGELYYPSYFTDGGYAIHGEGNGNDGGEVPPYPASHGCVRITNNAVLRYYYSVFTVGTSVWVYH